jgi:hypothetical protein
MDGLAPVANAPACVNNRGSLPREGRGRLRQHDTADVATRAIPLDGRAVTVKHRWNLGVASRTNVGLACDPEV